MLPFANQHASEPRPAPRAAGLPATPIPTDDPDAALAFCRALDAALAAQGTTPQRAFAIAPRTVDLSIVVPAHNEEANIEALYARLIATLDAVGLEYEIVFVNDGSVDRTAEILAALEARDRRVVVLEFARNFGHQIAVSAGLEHSRGRGVVVMDADLQDPPEILPQFIAKWREGFDVVYAIREARQEAWYKRVAYSTFYRLLQRVADVDIPLDTGDFCVMDRRVVNLMVNLPERNRFVRGLRSWMGFKQTGLAYERHARHGGRSTYSLQRLIYLALDGLVSFSYFPLRMISMLGFAISAGSFVLASVYAVRRVFSSLEPPGFATLIVAILFLAGIQLVTIGVIGEYVGRIFDEVKRRPLYILKHPRR